MALLEVKNLTVEFGSEDKPFRAVDSVSYSVDRGEVLGIVGESGSGKSVSSLAVMGLIDFPGRVTADALTFDGQDLLTMPAKRRRQITGKDIAMIFQDPMSALNPCFTVEAQIMEALKVHEGGNKKQRRERTLDLNREQLASTRVNLGLEQEILNRLAGLAKDGAVPDIQYLQQRNKVQELKGELTKREIDGRRQINQIDQQIEQLNS